MFCVCIPHSSYTELLESFFAMIHSSIQFEFLLVLWCLCNQLRRGWCLHVRSAMLWCKETGFFRMDWLSLEFPSSQKCVVHQHPQLTVLQLVLDRPLSHWIGQQRVLFDSLLAPSMRLMSLVLVVLFVFPMITRYVNVHCELFWNTYSHWIAYPRDI